MFNDDKWLLSGGSDKILHVWNLEVDLEEFEMAGHTDRIMCLGRLDKEHAMSGSMDCTIKIWKVTADAKTRGLVRSLK